MALNANALVTLAEAAAALGLTTPASTDATVESLINQASQLAETTYCMRSLKQRAVTNLRVEGPCGQKLYPPVRPIKLDGTITIAVDGVAQTVWKAEADGVPSSFDVLAFDDYFSRYWGWRTGSVTAENVVLTYTGGYATVPDDLKEAVLELIQKLYGRMVNRMPDVASISSGGVSIQTLDGQWAGGTPVSYAISKSTRDVFNAYKNWTVR